MQISDKSLSSDEQLAVDSEGEVLEEKPALRAEEGERSDGSGTLDMFETTTVKKKQAKAEQVFQNMVLILMPQSFLDTVLSGQSRDR